MIARRRAIGAAGLIPIAFSAPAIGADSVDPELEEARKLVAAFYRASNDDNWSFVSDLLSHTASGKTNHWHWRVWANSSTEESVADVVRNGPHGYIGDRELLYEFFRRRQHKQGWYWSQPQGSKSVWRPDHAVYASYVRWERRDGGSYFNGPIDHRPRILHLFGIDTQKDYGTVVSRKITWIEEVDLGNIVYG